MPHSRASTPRIVIRVAAFLRRRAQGLSGVGIVLGTLFFAAALTPTLAPRTYLAQGVLSGICFAAGYGIGVLWRVLWAYLELPEPAERVRRVTNSAIALISFSIAVVFLARSAEWQNSIRNIMAMQPVDSGHPVKVCLVALATFAAFLIVARVITAIIAYSARRAGRLLPRRFARVLGGTAAILLVWGIANGVLLRATFHLIDSSFREYDALLEPERPQPLDAARTGSPASLVGWRSLGRTGREFVASAPTGAQISSLSGRPAIAPIRVYVGLGNAGTARERAELALEELKRVGAFARSALVIVTPTGTGWIDPAAMSPVEYLQDGDVASVATQYSYLASPLSLFFQPDYGADAARELFKVVYHYWTGLPKTARPKLYVHGLSLGSLNSEKSIEPFEMLGDPIDGAVWSGPPFLNPLWRSFTASRDAGSPAWQPRVRDGRLVRFLNQDGDILPDGQAWGRLRIAYLQYASDAVTFFDHRDLYRAPDWLKLPRGPDVSPQLRWYPIVTALQVALDMSLVTSTPMGYGHVYAPQHYLDAWVAVTGAPSWSPVALAQLKKHLEDISNALSNGDRAPRDEYVNRGG